MDEDDVWVPLVDEPIGDVVARIIESERDLDALMASPRHRLALRTFAYIRVGLLLGQLLFEHDVSPEPSKTWVEELLALPQHYEAVVAEVRAAARDVAADPTPAEPQPPTPAEARERFRRLLDESGAD